MAITYVGVVAIAQEQAVFGYDGITSTTTLLEIKKGDVVVVVAQAPGNVGDCVVGSSVPIVARHHLGHPSGGEVLETALFAAYYGAAVPAGVGAEVAFSGLFMSGVWVGFEAHLFRGFKGGMVADTTHQGDGPWTVVFPTTLAIGWKVDAAPNNLYETSIGPGDDQIMNGPTLPTLRKRELQFFAIHVAFTPISPGVVHDINNTDLTVPSWTVTKRVLPDVFVAGGWWFGWRLIEPEGLYPVEGAFNHTVRWGVLWCNVYSLIDTGDGRGIANLHTRHSEYLVAWSDADGVLHVAHADGPTPPFSSTLEVGDGRSPCLAYDPGREEVHLVYEREGAIYRRLSDSDGVEFWEEVPVIDEGDLPCCRFNRMADELTAAWVETTPGVGELHGVGRGAGETDYEEFVFRDYDTEEPLSVTDAGFSFSPAPDNNRWLLAAYKAGSTSLTHWESWSEGRDWKELET